MSGFHRYRLQAWPRVIGDQPDIQTIISNFMPLTTQITRLSGKYPPSAPRVSMQDSLLRRPADTSMRVGAPPPSSGASCPAPLLMKRLQAPSQAHPLHPKVSQRILGRLTRDVKTHPEHWVNIKNYESGKKETECRPLQEQRVSPRPTHSRRRARPTPRLRPSDLRRLGKAVPKRDAHRHELILPTKPLPTQKISRRASAALSLKSQEQ